jgi:CBS domain containing-hemolysin-like protein
MEAFIEDVIAFGQKIAAVFTVTMQAIYDAFAPLRAWWDELEKSYYRPLRPTPYRHIKRRHHIAKLMMAYNKEHA